MRIAVLGGGPGGLYFAALVKQLDARHDVTVWERNAADDTFGFGVVFSDETLGGIEHADIEVFSGDAPRVRPLGRHRRAPARHDLHLGRARLRRDEPQAAAGHPAGAVRLARGAGPLPHRGAGRGGPGGGPRPGGRRRRSELADPGEVRRYVPSKSGKAAVQVHLAGHRPGVRRVQVLHPGHPGRDHAGARLPVQRPGQHLHPGDARGRLAAGRVHRGSGPGTGPERRGLDRAHPGPVR